MNNNYPPEKLGRYAIKGVIGEGAMGVVYRAHDSALDRPVALKTVRADLLGADREDWLARFRQEATAVGRCQHPNIVAVYDFGDDQGTPFLALEYVVGKELKTVLAEAGRLPAGYAMSITHQVLEALDCAHRNGVIHRDIKPANVMVEDNGAVKVTDFGVARLDTSDLTQAGTMIGTPSYMSPEQFKGDRVSLTVDVYACGVLLYELLVGHPPFVGKSSSEVMYQILAEMPEYRGDGWALPPAFRAVINRALSKDQADRYQSAAQFASVLRRMAEVLGDDSDFSLAVPAEADQSPPSNAAA